MLGVEARVTIPPDLVVRPYRTAVPYSCTAEYSRGGPGRQADSNQTPSPLWGGPPAPPGGRRTGAGKARPSRAGGSPPRRTAPGQPGYALRHIDLLSVGDSVGDSFTFGCSTFTKVRIGVVYRCPF